MAANFNSWFTTWGGLHGSSILFAKERFLKVTLDRTGAAQIETENELRGSLAMRLMREIAHQLECLSMVREAAWDDTPHPPDEFDSPKARKKPRHSPAAPPPSRPSPNPSHKTAPAGRSHQPYSSSDEEIGDPAPPLPPRRSK